MALGNAKLMADLGVTLGELEQKADALRGDGATALFLAMDGMPGGVIAVADPIKSTTRAALDSLRKDGITDRDANRRQQNHRPGCRAHVGYR